MTRIFQDEANHTVRQQLFQSAALLDAKIAEILRPLDLDAELMEVVYAIDRTDGGTLADVGRLLPFDDDTLQRSVRALQLRGIVVRPKPKEKQDEIELRFTSAGRRRALRAHIALGRFDERVQRWMGAHADRLSEGLERLEAFPDFAA
jgi:hypothetical protein